MLVTEPVATGYGKTGKYTILTTSRYLTDFILFCQIPFRAIPVEYSGLNSRMDNKFLQNNLSPEW